MVERAASGRSTGTMARAYGAPSREGRPVQTFARQHGLTPSFGHRWRQEMVAESRRLQSVSSDAPAFAAVGVAVVPPPEPAPAAVVSSTQHGCPAGRVEIVLLNGWRPTVDAGIAPDRYAAWCRRWRHRQDYRARGCAPRRPAKRLGGGRRSSGSWATGASTSTTSLWSARSGPSA